MPLKVLFALVRGCFREVGVAANPGSPFWWTLREVFLRSVVTVSGGLFLRAAIHCTLPGLRSHRRTLTDDVYDVAVVESECWNPPSPSERAIVRVVLVVADRRDGPVDLGTGRRRHG